MCCRFEVLILLMGLLILFNSSIEAAPEGSKWKIGKPIVWYFAGPGFFNYVNDQTVSQLVAGGWNLGWAYSKDELDTYQRHGMRALYNIGVPNLDDPAQLKALDDAITTASTHPATYGYWIIDEPKSDRFESIGKVVSYLRRHDPKHLDVVNLLPVLSNADGDLITPYRTYLRQFIKTVKPGILCYDFYPFMAKGDGLFYFLNLMLIREESLKAGIPFINITQAIAHYNLGYRWPTANEMRWLSYTTLAYGGQGLSWYIYNDRLDVPALSGFFADAPDSNIPTDNYWAASRINRDFLAIAGEVQHLKSLAVYHTGPHAQYGSTNDERWKFLKNDPNQPDNDLYWRRHIENHLPIGGVSLPTDFEFQIEPSGKQDMLLGCFGKSGGKTTHVLIVNLDYRNPISTTIKGPGKLEIFHSPTCKWSRSSEGSKAAINLQPGEGMLVRLRHQ